MIEKINIQNWKQFKDINIDFQNQVTILTGENGTGKSSILKVLAKIIGWEFSEIRQPKPLSTEEIYLNQLIKKNKNIQSDEIKKEIKYRRKQIENIKNSEYMEKNVASLTIQSNDYDLISYENQDSAEYTTTIRENRRINDNQNFRENHNYEYFTPLAGVFIPSHREPFMYSEVQSISSRFKSKQEIFNDYLTVFQGKQISGRYYDSNDNPLNKFKAALIGLVIFSKQSNDEGARAKKIISDYELVLKKMLPSSIRFESLNVSAGELLLNLKNDEKILLDSVSSGIGTILELSWQILMTSPDDESKFIILIDEIENHLHPSLQREILPNLVEAFPNGQFIVATHSPFVVNSVKNSITYGLTYNNEGKVTSMLLDFTNKFMNSTEILKTILGVPVTMPIWAEDEIEKIIDKYTSKPINDTLYKELLSELSSLGYEDSMTKVLMELGRRAE
ncbi:AAA family ATPase [Enterococcus casseliflavus]|uniref:AAA family ATPase n=1 Tax=Enterococcus casseliflavus TaxID=37734 RepID=UPI00163D00E1|nr:AAA family ATPase [Enterococcus casseliflavus]